MRASIALRSYKIMMIIIIIKNKLKANKKCWLEEMVLGLKKKSFVKKDKKINNNIQKAIFRARLLFLTKGKILSLS